MNTVPPASPRYGMPLFGADADADADAAWPGDERVVVDWARDPLPELGPGLRAGLVMLVLLAHGLAAWWVMRHSATPRAETEPMVITARIVADDAPAARPSTQVQELAKPVQGEPTRPPAPPPPMPTAKTTPPPPPTPTRRSAQAPAPAAPPPVLASPRAATPPAPALPMPGSKPAANASPSQAPAGPAPSPPSQQPQPQPQPTSPATNATPPPSPVSTEAAHATPPPKELPMSAVRYLTEPPQVYPRASREMGETGVVRLKVLIDEDGNPQSVQVIKSSGFPRLDKQAVLNMNHARFKPHMEGGVPRAVSVLAEIVFNLD